MHARVTRSDHRRLVLRSCDGMSTVSGEKKKTFIKNGAPSHRMLKETIRYLSMVDFIRNGNY